MNVLQLRDQIAGWQAVLAGVMYILVFQVAFYLMPFTTETLWLWAFGIIEAIENHQVGAFFMSGEWWLALVFPMSVFVLGALSWYSARVDRNYLPGVLAIGIASALYVTEVVFMGRYEYALLYVLITPVAAVIALASHYYFPHIRGIVAHSE